MTKLWQELAGASCLLAAKQRCKLKGDGENPRAAGRSLLCLTSGGLVRSYPAKRNPPAMGTLHPSQWKFSRAAEGSSDGYPTPESTDYVFGSLDF